MPLDAARWQIDIMAADKTAQAFASVERRMSSLERSLAASTRGMDKAGDTGAGAFAMIGRAAGPLIAILATLNVAQRTWEAGMKSGALIDQAAQLGVATDALQAYRLVAAQNGVEAQQFDSALQRLTATIGQAKQGNEDAIERFDRLGVKILDASGNVRRMEDLLPEVARGLQGVSSETERNALAQELFGRSGSRTVTMLATLAQGTDSVTAAARAQAAIVERESLEAWNKLDAQLKVTKASSDAALASLGAPIATWALEQVNKVLTDINANLAKLKLEGQTLAGRAAEVDVKHLEERLAALRQNPTQFGFKNSEKALLDQIAAARARAGAQQAADAASIFHGDTPRYTPPGPAGASNPPPERSGASGSTPVKDTTDEIGELIKAIEKAQKEGQALTDRFGDGMAYAARETAHLNELLAGGYISDGTHQRALAEVTRQADDMARAYRGASGGWEGFVAGMEQGMADLERANSAFEVGKRLVDEMSDAIADLATGAEVDFGRILQSFLAMIVQMEMQAAASAVWKELGGKGGGGGGFIADLIASIGGGGGGGPLAVDGIPTIALAGGGRYEAGVPRITGENGWELDVPDRGGTVYNQQQLAELLGAGGGETIVVNQTVHVGEFVTTREWSRGMRAVEKASHDGAVSAVMRKRSRGGAMKSVFRGR